MKRIIGSVCGNKAFDVIKRSIRNDPKGAESFIKNGKAAYYPLVTHTVKQEAQISIINIAAKYGCRYL